jgi:hypothetical protein
METLSALEEADDINAAPLEFGLRRDALLAAFDVELGKRRILPRLSPHVEQS